jgi:hypothetical protein
MICSSDVASALAMAGILDYQSALQGQVNLTVTDLLGQTIAVLVNNYEGAGLHTVYYNTATLSEGMYMYTLNYNGKTISKRMVVTK